jgi:beta-phosphoglucomutase-like phosphatase (HAD superfamily)
MEICSSEIRAFVREIVSALDEKELRGIEDLAEKRFREIYRVRHSVLSFIGHVKEEGKRIALVTIAPKENVDIVLSSLRLDFDVMVSTDDVKEGKPDPEPYNSAIDKLGERRIV